MKSLDQELKKSLKGVDCLLKGSQPFGRVPLDERSSRVGNYCFSRNVAKYREMLRNTSRQTENDHSSASPSSLRLRTLGIYPKA